MKKFFIFWGIFMLAAITTYAQGYVVFSAGASSATKISTNTVINGPATGLISGAANYNFALFYSATATAVNGQTAAIIGTANNNYAFNDNNWTFVAYGTNTTFAGRFVANNPTSQGVIVPGAAGGTTAQFVVIGWSANIGSDITSLQNWLNNEQFPPGWIGQSAVSGAITLGNGGLIAPQAIFGGLSNQLSGFTLGLVQNSLVDSPYIYSQPTNLTVSVGDTASFAVLAFGDPTPTYQWNFNGTNIIGATNSFLVISNVQLAAAGGYSVSASNLWGSATSLGAQLTVLSSSGTPPSIAAQPANAFIGAGSNVTFAVAVSGSAPLFYQWSFNGTNLLNATNATLSLTNIQPVNAGNYAVSITNVYGGTNSQPGTLTVLTFPPIISAQPGNLSVQTGNQATFSVTATGTSPLSFQWTFNGTNLPGATASSLTISIAGAGNAGNYAVTISNPYGLTNSTTATLAVVPQSGLVFFNNNAASATKIFTNSAVGGPMTGLTIPIAGAYCYALYASTTAENINGSTAAILGGASGNYAFYDTNWTLVAYGQSIGIAGRFVSSSTDNKSQTTIAGFVGGTFANFVVIGWSANIGTIATAVQSWFNAGSPASDGWIGQSAVSGPMVLGNGSLIVPPELFGTFSPFLPGFTLGLASPNPAANYPPPNVPAPVLKTAIIGSSIKLSWPSYYSSYGVQSANSPIGPWSDLSATPVSDGTNLNITIPMANQPPFHRLIVQ